MARNVKISLAMHQPISGDEPGRLRAALKSMGDCVDHSAALGSELVAFPEICAQFGSSDRWKFEGLDGPTLTAMAAKARRHGIYVVCPLPTMDGELRRNSSVLIGRDGVIVGVYHKNFPTHGELNVGIVPGTETPVFETDFGRVGLSICFDLNYWEIGSGLCANRAELVIWSSMWTGRRMMGKWAMEFGFHMGGVHAQAAAFIDMAGREVAHGERTVSDRTGATSLITATLDLDRRLLHHDYNIARLQPLYAKYGPAAASAEWIAEECMLIFGSRMDGIPNKTHATYVSHASYNSQHSKAPPGGGASLRKP